MNFQIEIINVQATTKPTKKGSYTMLDVAFKNLSSGKIEGKKIMSFAQKTAFDILSKATLGNVFTVTSEKNEESGYWDWVNVTAGGAMEGKAMDTPTKTVGNASPKSTYETADERAKRQVLIVRQSSITAAISTLKTDKKELAPADVLKLAQEYCDWVFQTADEAPDFSDMQDDIPL